MRRWIGATLTAALLSAPATLQAQGAHDVRGVVVDTTGAGIEGAMVVALALPDSVITKFSLTGGDGAFTLKRVPAGSYLLQVTMVGHATVREPLTVAAGEVDAGRIVLKVQAVEMEALVVSVDHVPFVSRRDTLDYNALAFEVRPNATVEELLARLPGIEVDSDGTIRAQGEEVRNVLVDGKEFFGSDPTIATRNLPADAVERVQVYDKQSDMAEFTGIDDGQEERTINLELREDARRGLFGRLSGGVGGGLQPDAVIEAQPTGRTRYNQTFNVNRFTPTTQVALLGGANNVNEAGFAWGDFVSFRGGAQAVGRGGRGGGAGGGIQLSGGRNDGFTETLAFGLNASHDFSADRWLRTSYFYTGLDNTQRASTQQQQLLGSTVTALQSGFADQAAENTTHRINVNGQYAFSEGHDLRVRGNLNVGSSALTSTSTTSTATLEGEVRNAGSSLNQVRGENLSGSARLTWRKRISDGGRALVAEAWMNLQEPETRSDLETSTTLRDRSGALTTEDVVQEQSRTGRTLSFSQRLSLTQPVGDFSVLELFGERSAVEESQDNTVYDVGGGTRVFNDLLSSGFERTYSYARGGFRLSRNTEVHRLVLGLQAQRSSLDGTVLDRDEHIENGYTHLLPSLNYRMQMDEAETLNLRYTTRTREPSMTELQPFADNTNPVRTYIGNPDLQPEYTHTLAGEYRFFDQFSFVSFFTYLRASYTDDAIIQSRIIDDQALQVVRPVNAEHTWTTTAGITYGRPIRAVGARINVDLSSAYTRSVELINGDENRGRAWRNTVEAAVDNRDKDLFDVRVGARFAFNDVAYSLNPDLDQSYLDRTVFANGLVHITGGWTLAATLDYRLYDDEVFGAADRNVALLQAYVSRRALDDRVEVQLMGFDLLNQNQGVTYTNGPTYIQERRSESLGRYLMLKVNYRLGSFTMGRRGMGRGPGRR